jgi:hypothetical protein
VNLTTFRTNPLNPRLSVKGVNGQENLVSCGINRECIDLPWPWGCNGCLVGTIEVGTDNSIPIVFEPINLATFRVKDDITYPTVAFILENLFDARCINI